MSDKPLERLVGTSPRRKGLCHFSPTLWAWEDERDCCTCQPCPPPQTVAEVRQADQEYYRANDEVEFQEGSAAE